MLAPISWLKEYVDIKLSLNELMWKMTEAGLTTESFHKTQEDIVLDVEVTPNRPDWLSILGIARELAAIQGLKVREPKLSPIPKPFRKFPLDIKVNSKICPRYTGVIIAGVAVKPSPIWLQKRLKLVGLRPINNLVDITNYVMWERGVPSHVFDYDKFQSKTLVMDLSKGNEEFTSVDEISYKLPKEAIIIKQQNRVIDLCGIKGGLNTGITSSTKNIFIHVPIYKPSLIRRTSQALNLRSDASYIYERGANAAGTIDSLKRVVGLVLGSAGGKVASSIIDEKVDKFEPENLPLSLPRLEKILGLKIEIKKILKILESLNLSPKLSGDLIKCTIPTYRGDLKIEEDLIEEVARIYGYNNFPKTLPVGTTRSEKVPFYFDDTPHVYLKNLLSGAGFSEVMNFSLISEELIKTCQNNLRDHIKIANPVSIEYSYLRTSLVQGLLYAVKLNNEEKSLRLFELGKVYLGKPGNSLLEPYKISAASKNLGFREFKGVVGEILTRFNLGSPTIKETEPEYGLWHPLKSGRINVQGKILGEFGFIHPQVLENLKLPLDVLAFELDVNTLISLSAGKSYKQLPQYPAQIEDITLILPAKTKVGEVVDEFKKADSKIVKVDLVDIFQSSYTFRVFFQEPSKTLTDKEVEQIRKRLLAKLEKKFGTRIKN